MNSKILDKCFKNTSKNDSYIFFVIAVEFFTIALEIISITQNILIRSELQSESLVTKISNLNPFHQLQNALNCESFDNYNLCTFSDVCQISLIVLIILFFILYILNSKYDEDQKITLSSDKEKKSCVAWFFIKTGSFFANMIFLILHLGGIYFLFCFTNFLLIFLYSLSLGNYDKIVFRGIIFFFSSIFYTVFVTYYFSYVKNLNVIVQFHEKLSFHSDNIFSRTYDFFMIFMKIIISLTSNLIILENEKNSVNLIDSSEESDSSTMTLNNTNYKILFLTILILFIFFAFTLFIFYKLFNQKIIFIINTKFNLFRIFMINFIANFLLFLILFDSQLDDPILFGITLTIVFIFSIFITYSIYEKNLMNIFKSPNLIYQIAYGISKRNTQNLDQLNEDIYRMFMKHKLNCDKNSNFFGKEDNITSIKENLCQICEETEYTFETFLKTFYAQTKFQLRKELQIFSVEDMELFTMIELLYISILQKHKIIKLYFKIVEFLNNPTYRNKSVSLYLNIHRLKNFINLDNSEDIRIFRILKTYEETSNLLKKIIQISDDIYTFYEFEKEIYKRAEQINIARDEILSKILSLLKFSVGNDESEDFYSLILFKNIYEEIFNTNIDKYFYNFSQIEMDCKISEKFKTDRVMTIKYDVSRDNFLITKASNELKNFNMKKLEDLFPDDIKLLARKNFLTLIKENEMDNFQFDFMIKDPTDEIYIQNVSMKGRVCPSINFDELIINTTFEISGENLILFEENFLSDNKKFLKSFSKNMGNILCMNNIMLRHYKNYKFSFDDIFRNDVDVNELTAETVNTQIYENKICASLQKFEKMKISKNLLYSTKHNENQKFECEMNKIHYIDLCLKMNRIHLSNDGEDLINLSNLSNLIKSKKNQKFQLNLKQEIKRDYNTFSIYSIKISNAKITDNELVETNSTSELESISGKIMTNPSTPSTLSYMSNAAEKDMANFRNTKQALKSKSSTDNLNKLTSISSMFILFLIAYSFIFMIIGITDNKKIKESYSILMSFHKLKKTFYHTYTSLFNKFLLTDPNEIYFQQSYNNYFNNLSTNSEVKMKFDEIAMIELRSKIDLLQQRMLEFQNLYLNSNYKKQVTKIMDSEINYNIISSINGEFSLLEKNNNIFENMKTFMNLAQIIFEIQDIVKIDFINYKNGIIDFSEIKEKNYDTRQIFGMEIIINYINIFKQTETISDLLQQIQDDKLYSIYITTLVFFITFVLFHLFLIFICFYMIRSLRFLIANYLKLIDDLFTKNNITYMKKKLGILKVLCEQYFEDPSKLLTSLKHNKKVYGNKNRKERIGREKKEKEELQNLQKEMDVNYSKWENSERFKRSRSELILPIAKMIAIVFSIFYIYAFIFYFLIRNAHEKFSKSSLIFSLNSANENDLFNDYNLLQFIMFTRNRDNDLYNTLSTYDSNKEKSYIKNKIQSIQEKSFKVLEIVQKNSKFNFIFQDQKNLMDCNYLYKNLNDDVLSVLYQKNDKKELLQKFFIEVCDSFPFMKNEEINIINQEVNYNMQQILFKYETNVNDIGKVLSIYYQPTLYYLYYVLVYICRPIQQYINYTLIFGLVDNQENFYLFILLLFLSLNILIDTFILIFIKFMTTKKVLYISTYIENFIDAIRIV